MKSKKFKNLDIIIDNQNSWMWQYMPIIEDTLRSFTDTVRVFRNSKNIEEGEVLFILSCDKILKTEDLNKHKNNIVIHASDLPNGKGWSPWSWEIENGAEFLTLTLFEAEEELDSGAWYLKKKIKLNGSELIDDIRETIALNEFDLINEYLSSYPMRFKKQSGIETFYKKRTIKNQELDINKTILEQFNLLRVCDNENYPAHFFINGKKYIFKIEDENDE